MTSVDLGGKKCCCTARMMHAQNWQNCWFVLRSQKRIRTVVTNGLCLVDSDWHRSDQGINCISVLSSELTFFQRLQLQPNRKFSNVIKDWNFWNPRLTQMRSTRPSIRSNANSANEISGIPSFSFLPFDILRCFRGTCAQERLKVFFLASLFVHGSNYFGRKVCEINDSFH